MKLNRSACLFLLFISVLLSVVFLQGKQLKMPVGADIYSYWLNPDIRLNTGDTAGSNFSISPQITCEGDHVYVCWEDYRNLKPEIYVNYSRDRGATWQATGISLDTGDTPDSLGSTRPQITCEGDHVYVTWQEYFSSKSVIYFNCSRDRGATWQDTDMRLDMSNSPGTFGSNHPQITCESDHVYVCWFDFRNSNRKDIYFNYSPDRGATWQATDIRLNSGDTLGTYDIIPPQITCEGDNVYVCWQDYRNGDADIYFNYSADRGATWQAADIRLDTGDIPGTYDSIRPKITCEGDNVYVCWEDYRNGSPDIYFNYSADRGATWQAADMRLDTGDTSGGHVSGNPQIICGSGHVYVTWEDFRNGEGDIYFNYSADRGVTWQAVCIRLDTGDASGATSSYHPHISCTGDHVYVCWEDYRDGEADICLNYSADRGATWQARDMRLDTGDTPGAHSSGQTKIICTVDHVYAVWCDYRNGFSDIYLNATNRIPIAGAGRDMTIRTGFECMLDGSSSFDLDNDPLSFSWSFMQKPAGSAAELDSLRCKCPRFVPDKTGEYRMALTVTDPFGAKDRDIVLITAEEIFELTIQTTPGGSVNPEPGTYTYNKGDSVTLTAAADPGFVFDSWRGDVSGTANPLTVTMNADKTIIAGFRALVHQPLDFKGRRITNRSLSQAEYLVKLSWQGNPENSSITAYRICSGQTVLAEVSSSTFEYLQRGVAPKGQLTYSLVAVRADGYSSEPLEIKVN